MEFFKEGSRYPDGKFCYIYDIVTVEIESLTR